MAKAEERFYRGFEGEVIAVSNKVARELRDLYGVSSRITVIPHGVDASRFNGDTRARHQVNVRQLLGIDERETVALYIGDLTKAHSHLKSLSAALPQVKFVIITPSSRYHWQGENVQILPPTSELEKFYAAADVFVFPTTYDAFGMVVLEAMAAGLPVITSDQAGAAELIEPNKAGFVLPLDQFVDGAVEILRDRTSWEPVSAVAQNTARHGTWPSVVSAVEEVYQRALQT